MYLEKIDLKDVSGYGLRLGMEFEDKKRNIKARIEIHFKENSIQKMWHYVRLIDGYESKHI